MAAAGAERLAAVRAALAAGDPASARALVIRESETPPDDPLVWFARAELHRAHGERALADAAVRRSLALDPTDPRAQHLFAVIADDRGQPRLAQQALRAMLADRPHDLDGLLTLAAILEREHQPEEAATLLRRGLAIAPQHPGLNLLRARLGLRRGEHEAVEQALRIVDAHGDAHDRQRADQLRGRLALARSDGDVAAAAFAASNAARRREWQAFHPPPNSFLAQLAAMRALQTSAWYASWRALPPPAPLPFQPAFLVGFPRSGTTLLEQVLDAHPDCAALEERPLLSRLMEAIDTQHGGYPRGLATLDAAGRDALRAEYAELVQAELGAPPAVVVDKFPIRSADAALIGRVFPEARLLFAERDPRDVLLSCWIAEFNLNEVMACFTDQAEALTLYDATLALWREACVALPLAVTTVRYERLVEGFDAEVGSALAHLGLAWDDKVRGFAEHARGRTIRTPSYAQVTTGLYRDAIGRWRRFPQLLGGQRAALDARAVALGYPAA